ncbi:glycosyltransferase family 4 protein [Chthonobacter rhizosphaerae]|uniref:glycosyltransferase family 4 protein n=1 Tax=Chthonobacter rhizosphaerae TaxID=2735553 RepID=UPI0015EE467E|nr:glycosyltransferase family 4 protein [Chthonobacter rhizosphaerae]
MKVLIFSSEFPPFQGGIGTYAHEMATAAADLGLDVTVVAPDYGRAPDIRAVDGEPEEPRPYRLIRFEGGQHAGRDLVAKIRLVRRIASEVSAPTIVHAADWPFFIPLALSPFRGRSRCLVTVHGTEVRFMQHPKRAIPLRLLRFWNGWAEYVANSEYTADALRQAFSPPPDKVHPIGLGVGDAWLAHPVDRPAARRRHHVAADRFVIVTLGRLVPRKGHLVLAEALGRLPAASARAIVWRIVGPPIDRAYVDELQRRVAGLEADVRILGPLPRPDVMDLVAAADLFCLPAYRSADGAVEGFGLAFLEAAALGVPALATTSGGIPDAVVSGVTGLLVPPEDPAALAEALQRLQADPALRHALGKNAREHAASRSWRSVAALTYLPGSDVEAGHDLAREPAETHS